ncbi:MAG: DM13 domain-containing protein [Parcubacteria group bacterium]|nr:DM13 domain-containing protein [Parcubacteria group bacterium]
MNNKLLITVAVIVLVLIAGWYLLSPLFIDEVVDEGFPDSGAALTEDELKIMEEAKDMPDVVVDDGMPKAIEDSELDTVKDEQIKIKEPVALSTGKFVDVDSIHRGSGDATIYELSDGSHVLRFENFSVTNGPDLRVILSANESPKNKSEVQDDGFVMLEKLKGNKGNQNYNIPAEVDVSKYKSVVIYCYPFNVVFSTANLK